MTLNRCTIYTYMLVTLAKWQNANLAVSQPVFSFFFFSLSPSLFSALDIGDFDDMMMHLRMWAACESAAHYNRAHGGARNWVWREHGHKRLTMCQSPRSSYIHHQSVSILSTPDHQLILLQLYWTLFESWNMLSIVCRLELESICPSFLTGWRFLAVFFSWIAVALRLIGVGTIVAGVSLVLVCFACFRRNFLQLLHIILVPALVFQRYFRLDFFLVLQR